MVTSKHQTLKNRLTIPQSLCVELLMRIDVSFAVLFLLVSYA